MLRSWKQFFTVLAIRTLQPQKEFFDSQCLQRLSHSVTHLTYERCIIAVRSSYHALFINIMFLSDERSCDQINMQRMYAEGGEIILIFIGNAAGFISLTAFSAEAV